jgi:PAS domain S-box-containing protein
LHQFPVACQDLDRDGIIVHVNRRFCQLLGYEEADVLGEPVWSLIAPEEVERARKGYARKLAGDRPIAPFERAYIRGDGSLVTVEVHDLLMNDLSGAVAGIRSALVDVTPRTERERELHTFSALTESLIAALPEGMIVIDNLGLAIWMNRKAEALIGRPEADCLGLPIERLLPHAQGAPPDAALVRTLLAAQGGKLLFEAVSPPRSAWAEFYPMVDNARAVTGFLIVLR